MYTTITQDTYSGNLGTLGFIFILLTICMFSSIIASWVAKFFDLDKTGHWLSAVAIVSGVAALISTAISYNAYSQEAKSSVVKETTIKTILSEKYEAMSIDFKKEHWYENFVSFNRLNARDPSSNSIEINSIVTKSGKTYNSCTFYGTNYHTISDGKVSIDLQLKCKNSENEGEHIIKPSS